MDYTELGPEKLYVIGNGFDIHHKIKCKYSDFRKWLRKNRPNVYENLKWLYGKISGEWWRNFEENLTEFNPNAYPKRIARKGFISQLDFLVKKYGQEGRVFMDEYEESMRGNGGVTNQHHRTAAVAKFEMHHLKNDLYDSFGEWVQSLVIPKRRKRVPLDPEALFFTFNYTRTLEDLYGIDEDQVLHLHGSVDNNTFVIGHNMTAEQMQERDLLRYAMYRNPDRDKGADDARLAMFDVLEDEFKKPVDEIIYENRSHFNALSGINSLEVLGLSYSQIDLPYLRRIFETTGADIEVKLGGHNEEDRRNAAAFAKDMELTNWEIIEF